MMKFEPSKSFFTRH